MKYYLVGILCGLLTQACNQNRLLLDAEQGKQDSLLIRAREAHTLIEQIAYSFGCDPVKEDSGSEKFSYPDDCGGLYISEDKEVVVIGVGDTGVYRRRIAEKIGRNDFLMQAGTYSYITLKSVLNELVSFYMDERNRKILEEVGLERFGLDIQRNVISIGLKECNEERISLFKKKVMDSPVFIFEKSWGPIRIE